MGNCVSSNLPSDDYGHPQYYPMWVLKMSNLLEMREVHTHKELRLRKLLVEHRSSFFTVFVSHQWLSPSHPDPTGEKFAILRRALENVIDGSVEIQTCLIHQLNGQARRISSRERIMLKNGYVWMDWFSVPQINKEGIDSMGLGGADETLRCIKSIPFYVEASKIFLTLAPPLRKETGEICNYSSYLTRGWCRAEMWCRVLANSSSEIFPMVSIIGEERVEIPESIGWMRNPVHTADFTVEADRHEVTQILRIALDGRLEMLKRSKNMNPYRYLLSRYESYLGLEPPERTLDDFLSHFSFDTLQQAVGASKRYVSGLVCATLSADLKMMRHLVHAKADMDGKVPEMVEFDVLDRCRVIHLAMTQGAADEGPLLELLRLKADCDASGPFGVTALGFATTTKAVQLLLDFRAQVNFSHPPEQLSPLCSCCGRSAPNEVIAELLQQKADVNCKTGGWGITPAIGIAMIASRNVYATEHLTLLINARADIHQAGEPGGIFKVAGVLCSQYLKIRKLPWRPAVKMVFISNLGSTPLHIAAFTGSTQVAEYLIEHRADLHRRNRNGFTPLDLASEQSMRKMLKENMA